MFESNPNIIITEFKSNIYEQSNPISKRNKSNSASASSTTSAAHAHHQTVLSNASNYNHFRLFRLLHTELSHQASVQIPSARAQPVRLRHRDQEQQQLGPRLASLDHDRLPLQLVDQQKASRFAQTRTQQAIHETSLDTP